MAEGISCRFGAEVLPRLDAVAGNLAATVLGFLDFAEVGASLTKLAESALREAVVATQELELRRSA